MSGTPIPPLKLVLLSLLLFLVACNQQTELVLPTPGPDFAGFGFVFDPVAETYTPFVATNLRVQTATPPGVTRVLVNGVDLEIASLAVAFLPDNILTISASFTNVTSDFEFLQPFTFTPESM